MLRLAKLESTKEQHFFWQLAPVLKLPDTHVLEQLTFCPQPRENQMIKIRCLFSIVDLGTLRIPMESTEHTFY